MASGASGLWERAKAHPSDTLLVVLSVLLLATLGLASLYGFRYGNIDDSVMPGKVELACNDRTVMTLDIASMDDVTVGFDGLVAHGKLKLEGADTKSVLYTLRELTYENGLNPENTALLLRIPRGGLQGDLSGPWMVYFTQNAENAKHGTWALLGQDGTAYYESSRTKNPMVMQYPALEEESRVGTWQRDGNRILVSVPETKDSK